MKQLRGPTHSLPDWSGSRSGSHADVSIRQLKSAALMRRLTQHARLEKIGTLAQFLGFPRSGHSLIGAIVDAHPQARCAHELDVMGLIERGFSVKEILACIDRHCDAFTNDGRYWNGFQYALPGGEHVRGPANRLFCDKKGDMAVRRRARSPALFEQLQSLGGPIQMWICVLRNPFDNIATMSLRRSPRYDQLRAEWRESGGFDAALAASQAHGEIASTVASDQVDGYERLCGTVARLADVMPASHWHTMHHESLIAKPADEVSALFAFLGLNPMPELATQCATVVHRDANTTRNKLDWAPAERARVERLIERHAFLAPYRNHAVS